VEGTWELVRSALARSPRPAEVELSSAVPVWVGRNEARLDARVRDADGLEHHVVAFERVDGVTIAAVFSQPPALDRGEPTAVVVNGPSGSGKSSVLLALAEASPVPCVTFDEPVLGSVDPALLLWPDRAPHIRQGFLDGISAMARAGNLVAVSAGGIAQARFVDAFQGVRTLYVGLDCPIDVLRERERGRDGRWGGLAEQSLADHDAWTYDLRVDTSSTSSHAIATAICARLQPD
jgi:chloramphenicol 3-O phosphotransferase